jgi:hypothetical protein
MLVCNGLVGAQAGLSSQLFPFSPANHHCIIYPYSLYHRQLRRELLSSDARPFTDKVIVDLFRRLGCQRTSLLLSLALMWTWLGRYASSVLSNSIQPFRRTDFSQDGGKSGLENPAHLRGCLNLTPGGSSAAHGEYILLWYSFRSGLLLIPPWGEERSAIRRRRGIMNTVEGASSSVGGKWIIWDSYLKSQGDGSRSSQL